MNTALIHPRILEGLSKFYWRICSIQAATETLSESGEVVRTWATHPGHEALKCGISVIWPSPRAQEHQAPQMTVVKATHQVSLYGYYDSITVGMRVSINLDASYNILAVEHDSQQATTRLLCEVATT